MSKASTRHQSRAPRGSPADKSMTWELSSSSAAPQLGPVLRLGARAVPTRAIVGYVASSDRGADTSALLMTLAVFAGIAVLLLGGVVDLGWRPRFLLAGLVFAAIGLSALHDMIWLTTSSIHRVEIMLASGEIVRYATINQREQTSLIETLDRVVARAVEPANHDQAWTTA